MGDGLRTSAVGLGTGMTGTYGPADEAESIATIHAAVEAGITLLDTADFYGAGHSELLIGRALRDIGRDRVQISAKFGGLRAPGGEFVGIEGRPAHVKNFLGYTLRRLGTDHVDVYRPARLDPAVPIEDTVGAIADLVTAGYVRHIGLSEVGPATIRRAAATHPISDLQIEYSLFSRGVEGGILDTCREQGIGVTAYGVLAQGLLTGAFAPTDDGTRGHLPRFHGDNLAANLALVERLRPIAAARGATVAQLAVAWVLAQAPTVVALVGASRPGRIPEAASVPTLDAAELAAIEQAVPADAVAGERYAAPLLALLDSER